MAVNVYLKTLCILYLFVTGPECKKIDEIEERVNILEQKFGIQTYENTLMKKRINNLKTTVLEIVENITDMSVADQTNRNSEFSVKTVDMSDINQEHSEVVQITKSLLNAFKAEKQERIKAEEELEALKETEKGTENELNMLKENLAGVQDDLKRQEEVHKQEKELMQKEIDNLMAYKATMEDMFIKEKVLSNENEISRLEEKVLSNENKISKLATKSDREVNTLETKYTSVVTAVTGIAEHLKSQQIAFSARLSSSIENLNKWKPVVFDNVITNTGNAYSGQTGIFTAPIPGVYMFYTHILAADRSLEMSLQWNSGNVLLLYVDGDAHGADSNMIVLHLDEGDEVKVVKHGPYGSPPFYVHHVWSTFSGYILYPTIG